MRYIPIHRSTFAACVALTSLALLSAAALAEVKPDKLFTDHMVLQRGKEIRVWGTGDAGEKLSVAIDGKSASATVKSDGKWRVELPAMKADGKTHTLAITSGEKKIELTDIQIGDVWLLAGQSNMSAAMGRPKDTVPGLRLMSVDHTVVHGWHIATPSNVVLMPHAKGHKRWRSLSYVAYHFGRHLHEKLKIPVAVVHGDHGGASIATFLPNPAADKPAAGNPARAPGNLYWGKIVPVAPLQLGGVVWWQGEDDGRNAKYADDLMKLAKTWRKLFEQPKLPFIAIQIAPNNYSGGPLLVWEAQSWAVKNIDGFYLAANQDAWASLGKSTGGKPSGWPKSGGNPHPPRKDRAARRAADIARHLAGDKVGHEVFAPMYVSHEANGGKILVKFDHVGDRLKSRDEQPLTWFEIAGDDMKYVRAEAKIVGKDTVEVSAPGVAAPQHVRYGWSPVTMTNLVNSAGLPAITFRSNGPKR